MASDPTPTAPELPFLQSIPAQAADRRTLCFPLVPEARAIGTSFSSKMLSLPGGPFLGRTPFDRQKLAAMPLVYDYSPSSGSFEEHTSSSTSSTYEHLGVGFGVSIGGSFLGASVSGSYNKSLLDNQNAIKTSQSARVRRGHVRLSRPDPELSDEARGVLARGGVAAFEAAYGDYYVGAFGIGADSAVCLSFAQADRTEAESYSITITVKVLFFSASHTWSHEEEEQMHRLAMTVDGYDTLAGRTVALVSSSSTTSEDAADVAKDALAKLREAAAQLSARNITIAADVDERLRGMGLSQDGGPVIKTATMSAKELDSVFDAGLVVEAFLFPYTALPAVAARLPRAVDRVVPASGLRAVPIDVAIS